MSAQTVTKTHRRRGMCAAAAVAVLIAAAGCSSDSTTTSSATSTAPTSAENSATLDPAVVQRLDAAIDATMAQTAVPGAIVGIWGPDGSYVKSFGVADKSTGAPMQTDFYSRIGSLTKTFTATGVLQLVDEGKVGLDDPISKYVEGVPAGDQITIRELARMQSGLANYSESPAFQKAFFADPRAPFTPQQLLGYAFAEPATFPPGQGFQYCNTNYTLLGLVVEKVSGLPLPDYVQQKILAPLHMDKTVFPTTNAFPDPHAQGYTVQTADGKEAAATDWDPSWGWAAGAMISTLDDLHTWGPALATGTLLTPETQAQRLETVNAPGYAPNVGYGLGIFNADGWIGHNGSLPGYQTVTVYLPEKKTTLVIMTNTDVAYQGGEPSTMLGTAITQVITPDHVYRLAANAPVPAVPSSTTPTR
ncbi:beta-lactamase family protein [Rhodococcus spelaei]|uniref:Beta-lactamase family protein n=1 Tax=Rhodococcus spelaei TaxID=2546320 RepID=A0A541B0B0_9NOCA|nr:serine hydrolase domain-containing protein [Rhodococcus spelaei]TQF65744.1 beta-lactamase family protein [Rhodococcus spelaei]